MTTILRSLEIQQLEEFLKREFSSNIIGLGNDALQRERNLLSKAVAAYFLMTYAGATKADAVNASIDGGGDHGVDSVYISPTNTIWLVQSKYRHDGVGEPTLAEAGLFRDGVNDFVAGRFERFNQALAVKLPQIRRAMDEPHQVQFALVYTGTSMDETRRIMFGDVEKSINAVQPGRARFVRFGLSDFHEQQIKHHGEPDIDDVTLELHNYGLITGSTRAYYGTLRVKELAALYQDNGDVLVRANIRRYKGSSQVNEGMTRTLHNNAAQFFYYNNGVTFLCRSILAVGPVDQTRVRGRFRLNGVSIINGAQTAGTVAQEPLAHYDANPADILVTIIEAQEHENNFTNAVTEYRNSQNAVAPQDFVSLDDNQESWRKTLLSHGITYIFKPSSTDSQHLAPIFTVDDAARFRAARSLDGLNLIINQPARIWDRFLDFEGKVSSIESPSVYKTIFPDTLTSRSLWRITQIGRLIQIIIHNDSESTENQLDSEYTRQSTWLVTHITLTRLSNLLDGATLTLTTDEIQKISHEVDTVRTALLYSFSLEKKFGRTPQEVFHDLASLRDLKAKVMQSLRV